MKKLFTIGLSLALAACVFIGCATTGSGGGGSEPGTLTITGIPEEYNGKFASFPYGTDLSRMRYKFAASDKPLNILMGNKPKGAVITNGEVNLLIYKDVPFAGLTAYKGSDTIRIELCIRDTEESYQAMAKTTSPPPGFDRTPDFIFPSVTFENGTATAKWDDAFKVGSITVTGIPGVYNRSTARININLPDEKNKRGTYLYNINGVIQDGTVTAKFYRENEDNYMPFTGTQDINVNMGSPQGTVATDLAGLGLVQSAVPLQLLFKAQMTNDNSTLDFAQGIKQ